MKAYKAFEKDLTCRGYKFSETEPNITDEANTGHNGFHCAEDPLDCLSYYPDWENSVYYIVNAAGDINEDGNDSKISCTELTLIKKLNMLEFIHESVLYMMKHPHREWNNHVKREQAEAIETFAIARGKNPIAKGKLGTVIGIAKELPDSPEINTYMLFTVDGKSYLSDTWYNAKGEIVEFESEDDI